MYAPKTRMRTKKCKRKFIPRCSLTANTRLSGLGFYQHLAQAKG